MVMSVIININGTVEVDRENTVRHYNLKGQLHRDDKDPVTGYTLPAVKCEGGGSIWCKNGKIHRDDKDVNTGEILPAIESFNHITGIWNKYWFINGVPYILIKI